MNFRKMFLYYQAEAYLGAGQTQEAEAVYQELSEGSNPGLACCMRGQMYLEEGDTEKAAELFREAVGYDNSYDMYIRIYEAYTAVRREADGAVYLREALELVPSEAQDLLSGRPDLLLSGGLR